MESKSENFSYFASEATSSACAKAIIVGEHAVMYGATALAMPLNAVRMTLNCLPVAGPMQESRLFFGSKEASHRVSSVVQDGMRLLGITDHTITIKGQSKVPVGAGLGSSASLCVGILKVLSESFQLNLGRAQLAELGNQLEQRFHGKPSGLDTSVIAYERCIDFQKGRPPAPITIEQGPKWHLALVDSNVRAATLSMIRVAEPSFRGARGDRMVGRFDDLAKSVIRAFTAGQQDAFAEALTECNHLLHQCGVVTPKLVEMIQTCLRLGASGAKITGAGGGGSILVALPHDDHQAVVHRMVRMFGAGSVYLVTV